MIDLSSLCNFVKEIALGTGVAIGSKVPERLLENAFDLIKREMQPSDIDKIRGLPDCKTREVIENIFQEKNNLRKEIEVYFILYKYLQLISSDSYFTEVVDLARMGEGMPLMEIPQDISPSFHRGSFKDIFICSKLAGTAVPFTITFEMASLL